VQSHSIVAVLVRPVTPVQMSRPQVGVSSLLGDAYQASAMANVWAGCYRTGSIPTAGWSWVDGTNATNLNCGSASCGPWSPGNPDNFGGVESRAQIWVLSGAGLNDRRDSDPLPFACEIEVCGPGQYLGPNFTTGCLQCPAGRYSVGGAVGGCMQCPPGTFGSSPGLSTSACSGNCSAPAGSACLAGSTSAPGTLCPVGQYSLAGAGVCTNCSAGTYGSSTGLTTAGCSGQCAAGRFGSVSGLSSSSCEGACIAGYRCPLGSTNATAAVCPPGQYSLSGWSMCSPCPVGLYGESPALPSSTCTAPCPPGRFGSIPGLSTSACSGPCDAGRFGSQPGVNASSCTAACPAGYFCPPGTANATANVRLAVYTT
jgi:hypothetical protein